MTYTDPLLSTAEGTDPKPPSHAAGRRAPVDEMRRIPPSGDVSPDGTRPWPRPSRAARLATFGGVALVAAAGTVGALLAVRALVERAGDEEPSRRLADDALSGHGHYRPMPAGPQQRPRPAREARAQRPDASPMTSRFATGAPPHEQPMPPLTRRPSPTNGINSALAEMSAGVGSLLANVTAAMEGFRSVGAQAGTIAEEFHEAAERLCSILGTNMAPDTRDEARDQAGGEGSVDADDPLTPEDDSDPRRHRL